MDFFNKPLPPPFTPAGAAHTGQGLQGIVLGGVGQIVAGLAAVQVSAVDGPVDDGRLADRQARNLCPVVPVHHEAIEADASVLIKRLVDAYWLIITCTRWAWVVFPVLRSMMVPALPFRATRSGFPPKATALALENKAVLVLLVGPTRLN